MLIICVCVSILIYISIYKLHKSPPKDILSLLSKKYGSKKLDQFPDHQQKKQLNSDFPLVFSGFLNFGILIDGLNLGIYIPLALTSCAGWLFVALPP